MFISYALPRRPDFSNMFFGGFWAPTDALFWGPYLKLGCWLVLAIRWCAQITSADAFQHQVDHKHFGKIAIQIAGPTSML